MTSRLLAPLAYLNVQIIMESRCGNTHEAYAANIRQSFLERASVILDWYIKLQPLRSLSVYMSNSMIRKIRFCDNSFVVLVTFHLLITNDKIGLDRMAFIHRNRAQDWKSLKNWRPFTLMFSTYLYTGRD